MVPEAAAESLVVAFARRLRSAGIVVPVGAVLTFSRALDAVGEMDGGLYWAGRATLVCRPEDTPAYDEAYASFFGSLPELRPEPPPRPLRPPPGERAGPEEESTGGEAEKRATYSARERLWQEDFARYGTKEWEEAEHLIKELAARPELRRVRRLRTAARPGRVDLGRTVRKALSHDGEALLTAFLAEAEKPRRLVFLVDISGSMKPYARAFLRLAHAATSARPAGQVETFVLGTRLTRLTRQLAEKDPDRAFAAAGRTAQDWYGGTRLGEGLRAFNTSFGSRGLARGALVLIVSDGWERGDPALLGEEMARLSRLARRIVWANPLRASPGYEPLAAGMAAALPFADDFVSGHSFGSLVSLVELIGRPAQRKRPAGGPLSPLSRDRVVSR